MAQVGYIRVSTTDQNTARQLRDVSLDKIFEDHCSGKDTNRPALRACMEYLREGDTLHCHSIDRLGRSMGDLLRVVEELTGKGISIRFHKENLVFSPEVDADPFSRLQFQMLAAFSAFERSLMLERQKEGLAAAKAAGKQLGRKPKVSEELKEKALSLLEAGMDKKAVAAELGLSRTTLYKLIG